MNWLQNKLMWGKTWFGEYGKRLYVGIVILLVGLLSFLAGNIHSSIQEIKPLLVSVPSTLPEARPVERTAGERAGAMPVPAGSPSLAQPTNDACVYVGSKNSNKYHLPTSRCAKQIKPENRVCFASTDAASKKGYLPGCLTP